MIETVKMGRLRWHHIHQPIDKDFDFLKDKFHFHPLDIEDCKSLNQRPKIDIYDDYYFLILRKVGRHFFKISRLPRSKAVSLDVLLMAKLDRTAFFLNSSYNFCLLFSMISARPEHLLYLAKLYEILAATISILLKFLMDLGVNFLF